MAGTKDPITGIQHASMKGRSLSIAPLIPVNLRKAELVAQSRCVLGTERAGSGFGDTNVERLGFPSAALRDQDFRQRGSSRQYDLAILG